MGLTSGAQGVVDRKIQELFAAYIGGARADYRSNAFNIYMYREAFAAWLKAVRPDLSDYLDIEKLR